MTEKLIEGQELRKGIQAGINKLANTVKDTLGPMGNTVIIRNAFGEDIITKDGVSVAEEIFLQDPVESVGAELVKQVSIKANNLAGDGTTTATVLAQAIYNEGVKQIELGAKPLEFKKGLKQASIDILKYLEGKKKDVTADSSEIKSVALISSNGDEDVAETITNIYKKLGKDAVISVTEGGVKTEVNIVQGMQFDRGYLSPYCVTDRVKMKAEFLNPFVLLYDGKISDFKIIHPAMEYAAKKARPLIIVAENVQDGALRGLVLNHAQGNIQSAIVQSPGYGNKRVERLRDMAALFGASVFSPDENTDQFEPSDLGEMERAEITNKDTAFINGSGDKDVINNRIAHIVSQLEFYKGNTYETGILEERLGKLSAGVSVVRVGAVSKEEAKELLDRVDDCKFAVKAALVEGVVDGGGMALYNASNSGLSVVDASDSFIAGYNALLSAVRVPFKQILINAGEIPEVIEASFNKSKTGYDVKNGKFVASMSKAGIIDPFKVVRIALESSVSIVGTLLTSNYAVVNKQDTAVQNYS